MPKLTKRLIDATAPAPGKDVVLWDSEIPGFGLRVKPSGVKSFMCQYRNKQGVSRRMVLGRYGVFTPEQARQEARLVFADVARGLDPAERRLTDRSAMTVADLCREYLERAEKGLLLTNRRAPKKASTLATDRGRIERHIIPLLGRRIVKEVTSADVRAFLRDVTAGKTAADVRPEGRKRIIVKGGPGAATRTTGLLSGIFSYAVQENYCDRNPVNGVKRHKDGRRKVRLDGAGYAKLGELLRRAEAAGEIWQAIECVRFLAVTGCRRGEALGLQRSELDFANRALRLTDTKTGESIRPLSAVASNVASCALARSPNSYVFPSDRKAGNHFRGIAGSWSRIVGAALPGVTPHTLRHSFASTAEDLGYSLPTIGALLGHSARGVTEGYVHKLDAALVAAADRVARHIAEAMGDAAPSAEVVELHPQARASA